MTDYQEQLAECQANNKNLFASVGEAGKGFGALHAAACIKAGASREEFVEAISVAIMMAGGPATVYGGKALACFDQLSK